MICKEASEQSKRTTIPNVSDVMTLQKLANVTNSLKLICSLNNETKPLKYYLKKNIKEALFVIGPEGGFSKQEIENLVNLGFIRTSLGKRILRAETAAIYALSVIGYLLEK